MDRPQRGVNRRDSSQLESAHDDSRPSDEVAQCKNLLGSKSLDRFPVLGHALLIVVVSSAIFFCGLGDAPLWDRDEPRNAGCAAEMMARGDWVVPIFNDELRPQKPVLIYWLIMSAYSLFGVSEFSARFWSAALGVGTALVTFGIGRRLFDVATGFLAALILASSVMFCVAARAATPDSVLIFCVTAAIYFYVRGIESDLKVRSQGKSLAEQHPQLSWFPEYWSSSFLGLYLMLGLAMLAKGPVGFVLPMAMIGMFMLLQRLAESNPASATDAIENAKVKSASRLSISSLFNQALVCLRPFAPVHFLKTLWAMRPVTGTAIALLVAAPWFVWVGTRTDGDFLSQFLLNENFGRATTVMENHRGGIWFYPMAILVGFFPWSVFWGPVAIGLIYRSRRFSGSIQGIRPGEVLLLSWIAIQVIAFSLVQTKLPSYVTPCYPALAMLTAHALMELKRSPVPILIWRIASYCLAATGLAISVGFLIASHYYFPQHGWLAALGLIPLLVGIFGAVQLSSHSMKSSLLNTRRIVLVYLTGAVLFCVGLFGLGPSAVGTYQQNEQILSVIRELPENYQVASYGTLESSWVFYGNKPVFELSEEDSTAKQSKSRDDEFFQRTKAWKTKAMLEPEQFLEAFDQVVFITTGDRLEALKNRLPDDFEVIQTAEYFFKNENLVLVGRINSGLANLPNAMERASDKSIIRH